MSKIEMAMPADGSEKHLAPKQIKAAAGNSGVNLDNDEDILQATDKSGGKWRFYVGDKLVAETDAPGQVNADILSQWGKAVRARCARENTFVKEEKKAGGIVDSNGNPVSSADSSGSIPAVATDPVREASPASLEDDPDAFVQSKITAAVIRRKAAMIKAEQIQEEVDELAREIAAAEADEQKWRKMAGVINE